MIDLELELGIDKNLILIGDVSLLMMVNYLAYFPPPIISEKYDQKWPYNPFESINSLIIAYYGASLSAFVLFL